MVNYESGFASLIIVLIDPFVLLWWTNNLFFNCYDKTIAARVCVRLFLW